MTWLQLRQLISEMPEEHQNDDVTVYLEAEDEFVGVFSDDLGQSVDGDVADGVIGPGEHYLVISDIS